MSSQELAWFSLNKPPAGERAAQGSHPLRGPTEVKPHAPRACRWGCCPLYYAWFLSRISLASSRLKAGGQAGYGKAETTAVCLRSALGTLQIVGSCGFLGWLNRLLFIGRGALKRFFFYYSYVTVLNEAVHTSYCSYCTIVPCRQVLSNPSAIR